jgi:hypothetical protein
MKAGMKAKGRGRKDEGQSKLTPNVNENVGAQHLGNRLSMRGKTEWPNATPVAERRNCPLDIILGN